MSVLNVTDVQQLQNGLHLEKHKKVRSQHQLSFCPSGATKEIRLGLEEQLPRVLPGAWPLPAPQGHPLPSSRQTVELFWLCRAPKPAWQKLNTSFSFQEKQAAL